MKLKFLFCSFLLVGLLSSCGEKCVEFDCVSCTVFLTQSSQSLEYCDNEALIFAGTTYPSLNELVLAVELGGGDCGNQYSREEDCN